jgi:hypothetical protein
MTDLVERLRRKALYGIGSGEFYNGALNEAADRIEALEAALWGAREYINEASRYHGTPSPKSVLAIINAALPPSLPGCPHCGHRHPPDGMCV